MPDFQNKNACGSLVGPKNQKPPTGFDHAMKFGQELADFHWAEMLDDTKMVGSIKCIVFKW
jgi:hypothetical protein